MSCGVCCRWGLDPVWLWLWRRPGAAALIRPLAWERPYATGAALKSRKKEREGRRKKERRMLGVSLVAQWKQISLVHEAAGLIPGLAQWVKDPVLL